MISDFLSDASISAIIKDHMIVLGVLWATLKTWAKLKPSVISNTIMELFSQMVYRQDAEVTQKNDSAPTV